MPTFDGGHCFLTALLPISTGGLVDQTDRTGKIESHNSHVHLVREILSILPTANQSPFTPKEINSPFARNNKTHFVRMAIIDDVTFNGRVNTNRLSKLLTIDPMVAQPVDSLNCPYLMFVVDFDAPRGDDVELDGYLRELWTQIGADLAPIFMHCHGFAPNTDEHAFAAFVKERMIETTMPFNDYWPDKPPFKPLDWVVVLAGAAAAYVLSFAVLYGLTRMLPGRSALQLFFSLVAAAVVVVAAALFLVKRIGSKPFPRAPDSDLPSVLKALYLQRAFAAFAIRAQAKIAAATPGPVDALGEKAACKRAMDAALFEEFGAFLAENKIHDLVTMTQSPGTIGIVEPSEKATA